MLRNIWRGNSRIILMFLFSIALFCAFFIIIREPLKVNIILGLTALSILALLSIALLIMSVRYYIAYWLIVNKGQVHSCRIDAVITRYGIYKLEKVEDLNYFIGKYIYGLRIIDNVSNMPRLFYHHVCTTYKGELDNIKSVDVLISDEIKSLCICLAIFQTKL